MNPIIFMKMRNGDDVLAEMLPSDSEDYMIVRKAIHIMYDTKVGVWSKKWLVLAEGEIAMVPTDDVLLTSYPSDLALEYYYEYSKSKSEIEVEDLLEQKITETIH